MGGAPESLCGRRLVSNLDIDAEIIRRIIPQARGIRLQGVGSPHYRRQRLIGDLDQLGCVLGLIDGLGDDHGDGLANKARLIGRHRVVEGRDRLEASNARRHIRSAHEPCAVWNRPEPIGDIIPADKHGEHTWGPKRCRFVDRCDVRMSVRRAHDHGMCQFGQMDVLGEASSAGEEPEIFVAPHRLTNAVRDVARQVHTRYSTYPVGASIVY
jgi:hypothetical protein